MFNLVVQEIGKDFRIYSRPVDRLIEAIRRKPRHQLVTVLEGISFTVGPHQSLGIVGDNGAGKSTLLKILAGTLTPSKGRVQARGRVSALLELGAGFHPEFTGRQNIQLNGALLGLSKTEIQHREPEIIRFCEIGPYIDRPVKTYSSGMALRLAFSIATSVDPDILIIDEALSVGDLAFQKKGIDRMNRFREMGKTMVFCSHSMYHVQELCEKAIWLDKGRIRMFGKTERVAAEYTEYCHRKRSAQAASEPKIGISAEKQEDCRIRDLQVKNGDGRPVDTLAPRQKMKIEMLVEVLADRLTPQFGFGLVKADDTPIYVSTTHMDGVRCGPYRSGEMVRVTHHIPDFPLREGEFMIIGAVSEPGGLLWYEYRKIGPVNVAPAKGLGILSCGHHWEIVNGGRHFSHGDEPWKT